MVQNKTLYNINRIIVNQINVMLQSALFIFIDLNMLIITMVSIVNAQRICCVFSFKFSDFGVLLIGVCFY